MGLDLELYVADSSIESPTLSRSFKDEIIFEWHFHFNEFLNPEEEKIIQPNEYGEITIGEKKPFTEKDKEGLTTQIAQQLTSDSDFKNLDSVFDEFLITSTKLEDRERDPMALKEALLKTEKYLKEKSNLLPLVHSVYSTKDLALENEIDFVIINGVKGHIEGDLFHYDDYELIRNKIHVRSYYDDTGKVDLLLDVSPKITINNKYYWTKSISKAEQFRGEFEKCYKFLDEAIENNKKVLWEFG